MSVSITVPRVITSPPASAAKRQTPPVEAGLLVDGTQNETPERSCPCGFWSGTEPVGPWCGFPALPTTGTPALTHGPSSGWRYLDYHYL